MINTLLKINLSKIGWEGGGSTSILIMSLNILLFFLDVTPKGPVIEIRFSFIKDITFLYIKYRLKISLKPSFSSKKRINLKLSGQ